jgi:thiol-disulfide isomerase/thioredoxin
LKSDRQARRDGLSYNNLFTFGKSRLIGNHMSKGFTVPRILTSIFLLAVSGPMVAGQSDATRDSDVKVGFGKPFPAGQYNNLNVQAGGPGSIDLGQILGKKPILLLYWIPGNPRADAMLQSVQALIEEIGPEKLALFAVVYPRPGRDVDIIEKKLSKLGIRVPVLRDEGFNLGRKLRVQTVPNITIVDSLGMLRLTNGASLMQVLEYNMTLETAIRRVANKGELGTYGFLTQYYPVKELVGKKCPDFQAPLLSNSIVQSWYSMIKKDQLNVLVFWSVDCPHCRKSLPAIDTWVKEHPGTVNVIGAVKVTNEATKIKTEEYCQQKQFSIPMLVDQDLEVAKLYQITSTPTVIIIRPDGIIDSVLLSSTQDFVKVIEEKRRDLLKSAG